MTTRSQGRHRAGAASKNRMSLISDSVSAGASTYRRRSAVLAASSGLVVSMGLPALVSPLVEVDEPSPGPGATQPLQVVPPLDSTGSISVPQDAHVDFALSALTTVDSAQAERDAAARAAADAARSARAAAADRASRSLLDRRADAPEGAAAAGSEGAAPTGADEAGESGASASAAALRSASAAIELGSRYIGTPYRFGGTSPSGFDCSGFIQYVYAQLGVSLPRTAAAQQGAGTRVSAKDARPGDIVSFTGSGGVFHNGIYAGDGQMLDSPRSGKSIAVRGIWSSSVTFTRVA